MQSFYYFSASGKFGCLLWRQQFAGSAGWRERLWRRKRFGGGSGSAAIGAIAILTGLVVLSALPKEQRVASEEFAQSVATPNILAVRHFAKRLSVNPADFASFGIVSFNELPTDGTIDRFRMLCDAFQSKLPARRFSSAISSDIYMTLWPVNTKEVSDLANHIEVERGCDLATRDYGFSAAQDAIKSAEQSLEKELNGRGPYLIAWSPGSGAFAQFQQPLVIDMSDVVKFDLAQRVFSTWSEDIQSDPNYWNNSWFWNIELVRRKLREMLSQADYKLLKVD